MNDLRAFLRRHIEAFLDYEFGEAAAQNTTPPGARRPVWTSEHTQRLVLHLASNWEMVEEASNFRPWDQRVLDEVAADREGHREFMAELISQPSHQATCEFHTTEHVFMCPCGNPDGPHICDGCHAAAKESKMSAPHLYQGDAGERADEARQEATYEASLDQMADDNEGERVRQQEEADDRQAAALEGDDHGRDADRR